MSYNNKKEPPKDHVFTMRISTELLQQIDDWRRLQDDLPGRSEAMRRLIIESLNNAERDKKRVVLNPKRKR